MGVDFIDYPYVGTMLAFDGSTFDVNWVFVPDSTPIIPFPHPWVSGFNSPLRPLPDGMVGEIPALHPPRSRLPLPARVGRNCYLGSIDYWQNGWPTGTPGVVLAPDGFPVGCTCPGAAFDFGFDLGFES